MDRYLIPTPRGTSTKNNNSMNSDDGDNHEKNCAVLSDERTVSYKQKFRAEWLKQPEFTNWLTFTTNDKNDTQTAKCKCCNVSINNKRSDLLKHLKRKRHISNALTLAPEKQKRIDFNSLNEINAGHKAEAQTALFIACHTSIICADHLGMLYKKFFTDCESINTYKMHRTKCSAILQHVLAPHFKLSLLRDVGDSHYSLIIDESNDISVIKFLGIVIRYFSAKDKTIRTTFLHLEQLQECNANAIVAAIKRVISLYDLNFLKLSGLGTDNASVLVGINNGVYAKLKTELPNLILIPCVCHSLQLALSEAATQCFPRNIDYIISETYNWFSKSALRQIKYKQIFQLINDGQNPLKILQQSTTRWISVQPAVERIVQQWLELQTHFKIAATDERCYSAQLLANMYSDDQNLAYLLFLKPILNDVQCVNKAFEARNADPTQLFNDLERLLQSLTQKLVNQHIDIFHTNIDDYIMPTPYLGHLFERKLREMESNGFADSASLRSRCIAFLKYLIIQIRNRFPKNFKILKFIKEFSVDRALRQKKPSINELIEVFGIDHIQISKLETQWNDINFIKWEDITNTESFWSEVYCFKNSVGSHPFREISEFAIKILSLPYSNAEVERVFSQMSIIKNKLRNRMLPNMVNSILTIRFGLKAVNKCCDNYDIPANVIEKVGHKDIYCHNRNTEASSNLRCDDDDYLTLFETPSNLFEHHD